MRATDLAALARPRVSLMVGAATAFGAAYHPGPADAAAAGAAALGSALVCAGCSALNQVQERERDARMERTRSRPLACGRMSARSGLAVALGLLCLGLGLYATAGGARLLALGLCVCAVYNGLYTPLKPVTGLALLLGGLSGAAPPLAGWLAAGGGAADPRILAVALAFHVWQVPHFLLIVLAHGRDYALAGFKVPLGALPRGLYRPLMGLWMLAYFTAVLGLAVVSPRSAPWVLAVVCMGAAALAGFAALGRSRLARSAADATLAAALACLLLV